MSQILCIDPGSRHTGSIILEPRDGDVPRLIDPWSVATEEFMDWLRGEPSLSGAVIELVGHYGTGMPAGADVFETCEFIGRMREILEGSGVTTETVRRQSVKTYLCGKATAKDANVRQALIDLWGGDVAIGGVKCTACKGKGWRGRGRPTCDVCEGGCWEIPPGPLHSVTGHAWSALAVGIYHLQVSR